MKTFGINATRPEGKEFRSYAYIVRPHSRIIDQKQHVSRGWGQDTLGSKEGERGW